MAQAPGASLALSRYGGVAEYRKRKVALISGLPFESEI